MSARIFLTLFVLALLAFPPRALAQDPRPQQIVGDQFEEKEVRWLFGHRQVIMASCLVERAACGAGDTLKSTLDRTAAALSAGLSSDALEFVREADRPELFQSSQGETHRVAVTGQAPGSKIIFNRDRIGGLPLGTLCAILFHELVHHAGFVDDAARTPDLIGARLAKHLQGQSLTSALDEAALPQTQILIFQPTFKETYEPSDIAASVANFALLSDGRNALDISLLPFLAAAECDADADHAFAQKSGQPVWVIDKSSASGMSVHVVSGLKNFCSGPGADPNGTATLADRIFAMNFELSPGGLISFESLTYFLRLPSPDDYFDQMKTAKLLSATFSAKTVQPGDSLVFTSTVQMLNQNTPAHCSVGFYSKAWPMQNEQTPVIAPFDSCVVEKTQDRRYRVTANLKVPAGLQAGSYSLYADVLNSDRDPSFIGLANYGFQVQDGANAVLGITSVQFAGVPALSKIGAQALTNSAEYQTDQEFDLVVNVRSSLAIGRQVLDLGLAVQIDSGLQVATFSAEPKDLGFAILKTSQQLIEGGTRLSYRVKIPRDVRGRPVFVLLVKRVLVEDAGRNWTEIAFPANDHMVLMDRFVNAN